MDTNLAYGLAAMDDLIVPASILLQDQEVILTEDPSSPISNDYINDPSAVNNQPKLPLTEDNNAIAEATSSQTDSFR